MNRVLGMALAGILVVAPMAPAAADPLNIEQLKAMAEGMGLAPHNISTSGGAPTYEVKIVTSEFNVPVALELSASGRYIWARSTLSNDGLSPEKALEALKRNAKIQPNAFWITSKGALCIGMPIDNRDVTPEHLRFVLDKIAADVAATQDIWKVATE